MRGENRVGKGVRRRQKKGIGNGVEKVRKGMKEGGGKEDGVEREYVIMYCV
jgi:hypothetical protein